MGKRAIPAKEKEKNPTGTPETADHVKYITESQPPGNNQNDGSRASSKLKAKKHVANIKKLRRSSRLQTPVTSAQDSEIEDVIKEITLEESDNEDEPDTNDDVEDPKQIMRNKSLEEKMDFLLGLLEAHKIYIEDLKSKVDELYSTTEKPCPMDGRYRRLYIDSQKNVDSLREENRQLSLKLQKALGVIEGYEKGYKKGANTCLEVLEKLKDISVIPYRPRAMDKLASVSAPVQAHQSAETSPETDPSVLASSAKRKKRLIKNAKSFCRQ